MAQQTDSDGPDVATTYNHLLDDDADADGRTVRAHTERMVVVPHTTPDGECIGLYDVHTTGGEYLVDLVDGNGDCPDMIHNRPAGGCKHLRRVRFMVDAGILPGDGDDATAYLDALDDVRGELASEASALREELDSVERLLGNIEEVAAEP